MTGSESAAIEYDHGPSAAQARAWRALWHRLLRPGVRDAKPESPSPEPSAVLPAWDPATTAREAVGGDEQGGDGVERPTLPATRDFRCGGRR
jgi:hypothetical protein